MRRTALTFVLLCLLLSPACRSDEGATSTPGLAATMLTTTPTATPPANPTPSTVTASPTPTATQPDEPVSRVATIRPGCKRVRETLSPDPEAPPVPADTLEIRDGLRFVPGGAFGILEYEECPVRTDLGVPSPDEAAVRASPLFVDLSAYAPEGFELVETSADPMSYSNAIYTQRFEGTNGLWMTVTRRREWRLPWDTHWCTGSSCVDGTYQWVDFSGVPALMTAFEDSEPLLIVFVRRGVLTAVAGPRSVRDELNKFAAALTAIEERPDREGRTVEVTERMLAVIQPEFGPASGTTVLVPCGTRPVTTTWCYRPESLQFGPRIRVEVGRQEAEGAIVFYLVGGEATGYTIDERYPPAP